MTTRTASVPKALAPLALGTVLGVATLSQPATELNGQLAARLAVEAVIVVLVSFLFFRMEHVESPSLATHFRQSALLYLAALFGWAMQGEGLTAPTGKVLVAGAGVMILSNAVSVLVVRSMRVSGHGA